MGTFFDIMPPKPVKNEEKPAPKRKSGDGGYFLFFVIIVLLIIFGINYLPNNILLQNTNTTATPTRSTVDFDLFSNDLSNTKTSEPKTKIRIINASGKIEETDKIKTMLTEAGFKIEQTTVTETTYNQTIIYYKLDEKTKGDEVNDALATTYNTKVEESLSLGKTYDILVVIGQN